MNAATDIPSLCRAARAASRELARVSVAQLNSALEQIAQALEANKAEIVAANAKDLATAKSKGLTGAMLQRLELNDKVYQQMVDGVRQIIALPCPLGEILFDRTRPNGLEIQKIRVPIGVIGIIYESRPNVTVDAAALCLKAGNAVVLRGGSEAIHSNLALATALQKGLAAAGLPAASVQLIATTDRDAITTLCQQSDTVDLLIPRGGYGLIKTVTENARMPVIKHFNGICHFYVHPKANFDMAEKIILNAKCQKPGVCNALEALLVDATIAETFLPRIVATLQKNGVEIRGDATVQKLGGAAVKLATEADWGTEYLDLILSVKVVANLTEAVAHMDKYGSHHSDGIITDDDAAAADFFRMMDSAALFWNASTRFNDGFEFGFGAEIGISTDKIHARGPMGLEELTSYKYLVRGNGQVRA
ncbi:MAG: glutamate-5-semialdehyde dehydrogenase [Verrucomicrobia bacterium Tous-C9LFEB]|nr:MAG: glutamate-5-semialdehyde dehydrogenase [Verrucomicrobia bacterium Tous-C9LFEB]